jgi:hypothetical protein
MPYLKIRLTRARLALGATLVSLTLLFALPVAAQADWGAIAVNPVTGRTGVSFDYRTAAGAKHRARRECGGGGCRAAVWVLNQYAALVVKRNGVFVAGVGRTKSLAYRRARERAHERSARRVVWVFSG